MIKFFRHIRKSLHMGNLPVGQAGKRSKYFTYAIGEIILVVIGILIALQINNWNEYNGKVVQLKKDLNTVLNNLNLDSKQLNNNINNGIFLEDYHKNIFTTDNDSVYKIENLIAYLGSPNLDKQNIGYKNLQANNTFQYINNESLKTNLTIYYESNLNTIHYLSKSLSEKTNLLNAFFLEQSVKVDQNSLKNILKKITSNPVFKEVYNEFAANSTYVLHKLKLRLKISNQLKEQLQKELELHD